MQVGVLMMMDEVQDMIARLCRRHVARIDFSPDLVKLICGVMDGHAGGVEAVSIASTVNSLSFVNSNVTVQTLESLGITRSRALGVG